MMNGDSLRGSRFSRLGLAGSLLAFATTGFYLAIMKSEGNNSVDEFGPWASMFASIGVVAAGASFVRNARGRALAFAAAAGVSTALGLVGLMSIGIFLLAVAVLLIAAAVRATESAQSPEAPVVEVVATGIVSFAAGIAVIIAVL
jgi:hypothetical protein